MAQNNPGKDLLTYQRVFVALQHVVLFLFLFNFNNLLHFAAEDFFGLKPYALVQAFGSYAGNTAALIVWGCLSMAALFYEKHLTQKNPKLFAYAQRCARNVRTFCYVLLGLIALSLIGALYRFLLGRAPLFDVVLLDTGLSLFTILSCFAVTAFASRGKTSRSNMAWIISMFVIAVFCGLGVFFNFTYASPQMMRKSDDISEQINFYHTAESKVSDFYRNKGYLPQHFEDALSQTHNMPASFRYQKIDKRTYKICITLGPLENAVVRRKVWLIHSGYDELKPGLNCRTITLSGLFIEDIETQRAIIEEIEKKRAARNNP